MHNIILIYHEVMVVWNRMSVEQEYDQSEMDSFFDDNNKEEIMATVFPTQTESMMMTEEEAPEITAIPVKEDVIYVPGLRLNSKAMKELAAIIICQISPNTNQYKSRYRTCHWTWGHIMQALINLGLIDKNTSNTYLARAMHAFLENRTEGSIRRGEENTATGGLCAGRESYPLLGRSYFREG